MNARDDSSDDEPSRRNGGGSRRSAGACYDIQMAENHGNIPHGFRLMNMAEVRQNWNDVCRQIPEWHICALEDGSIAGRGYAHAMVANDQRPLGHRMICR